MFVCFKCHGSCTSSQELVTHLKQIHGYPYYMCYQDGCYRTFRFSSSFKRHPDKEHGPSSSGTNNVQPEVSLPADHVEEPDYSNAEHDNSHSESQEDDWMTHHPLEVPQEFIHI